MRTSLESREDGEVDLVFNIVHEGSLRSVLANALAIEDETTTRTAQSLVSSGSDDIGVFEGAIIYKY
jgi:hypothetical protein